MKIIKCEQGSEQWQQLRVGLPTASQVDKIISPKKLQPSSQATTYRNQLLAEWLCGHPIDWSGQSQWMERGQEMEGPAREWYAFTRDIEVEQVGFIMRDDEKFGGSPDGLIGDDGVLEIKCPALHTFLGYLIEPHTLAEKYAGQVQSYLMLTGRAWADIVAYNPDLPSVVVRIERDERYIGALGKALDAFIAHLDAAKDKLAAHKVRAAA